MNGSTRSKEPGYHPLIQDYSARNETNPGEHRNPLPPHPVHVRHFELARRKKPANQYGRQEEERCMKATIPRCPLKKNSKEKAARAEEQREGSNPSPRLRHNRKAHGNAGQNEREAVTCIVFMGKEPRLGHNVIPLRESQRWITDADPKDPV